MHFVHFQPNLKIVKKKIVNKCSSILKKSSNLDKSKFLLPTSSAAPCAQRALRMAGLTRQHSHPVTQALESSPCKQEEVEQPRIMDLFHRPRVRNCLSFDLTLQAQRPLVSSRLQSQADTLALRRENVSLADAVLEEAWLVCL